jgi:hypothetical protein
MKLVCCCFTSFLSANFSIVVNNVNVFFFPSIFGFALLPLYPLPFVALFSNILLMLQHGFENN